MNSKWASLNPPSPLIQPSTGSREEKFSFLEEEKKFLNLLKTLERQMKGDDVNPESTQGIQETIIDSLSSMENLYMRRGLLEFDSERAHEMQTKMDDQNNSFQSNRGGKGNNGKKRKRGGRNGGSAGNISSILGIDAGNTNTSGGKEAYVLSNICRILIPTTLSSPDHKAVLNYPPAIITAACNVLIAICTHSRNNLPSATSTVEHSLIVSIASQVMSGISRLIQLLLTIVRNHSNNRQDCNKYYKALTSCCKCASVFISLTGIGLSRSVKVIENIQKAAETILWLDTAHDGYCDEKSFTTTKECASMLLATLPLAGNSDSISPTKLWTHKVQSICKELSATLMTFYPTLKRNRGSKRHLEKDIRLIKLDWIEELKNQTTSQTVRIKKFSIRIDGYISIISSLLRMDRYDRMNSGITCALPMKSLLKVLEQMFAFAPLSENKFLSTKPSLRDVPVEGGLLSPKAAITIANTVKYQGHILAQTLCSLLSNSSLIYGKQIIDMTVLSLQSSSSNALRMVVDPMSVADKNSDKKWLHSSVSLRSMAVQSFSCIIQRLGSNAIVSVREGVEKGLVYIVGFLLEQITDEKVDFEREIENEHWGSDSERAKLVETCIEALATCVSIFGGYILPHNREMIESVAITCLEHVCSEANGSIYCNNLMTKISILKFGISCVSTPWSDGSASTIVGMMRKTASYLRFDRDPSVSSMAYTSLNVCNSIVTFRAPPLVIVKRNDNIDAFGDRMNISFSTTLIEEGIDNARKNIIQRKHEKKQNFKSNMSKDNKKHLEIKKEYAELEFQGNTDKIKATEETKTNDIESRKLEKETSIPTENNVLDPPKKKVDKETDSKKETKENTFHSEKIVTTGNTSFANDDESQETGSDEEDFPMIVDCDPDDEDIE